MKQNEALVSAVIAAQKGDQNGFTYIYNNTYKDKYYVALKYMKNEQDALDVLQDSYVKAFKNIGMLKNPADFSAWMAKIVSNTAMTALKKNQPLLFSDLSSENEEGDEFIYEIADESIANNPEASYTQNETKEMVNELLSDLSTEQRVAIIMFYYEGLSIKSIADSMNCSENTVKSRLNLGRKKLKTSCEELQKKGYKLYSFAPAALLVYLLRLDLFTNFKVSVPAAANVISAVGSLGNTAGVQASSAAGIQAGHSAGIQASQGTTGLANSAGVQAGRGTGRLANSRGIQASRGTTGIRNTPGMQASNNVGGLGNTSGIQASQSASGISRTQGVQASRGTSGAVNPSAAPSNPVTPPSSPAAAPSKPVPAPKGSSAAKVVKTASTAKKAGTAAGAAGKLVAATGLTVTAASVAIGVAVVRNNPDPNMATASSAIESDNEYIYKRGDLAFENIDSDIVIGGNHGEDGPGATAFYYLPVSKSEGIFGEVTYKYNESGVLLSELIGDDTKKYEYDSEGRVSEIIYYDSYGDGSRCIVEYDSAGKVIRLDFADRETVNTCEYDSHGKLVAYRFGDGRKVEFEYDGNKVIELVFVDEYGDKNGSIVYKYDKNNKIKRAEVIGIFGELGSYDTGISFEYNYDENGLLTEEGIYYSFGGEKMLLHEVECEYIKVPAEEYKGTFIPDTSEGHLGIGGGSGIVGLDFLAEESLWYE